MKMRCLVLLLTSAASSVYGMQGEPKKALEMWTQNGYIKVPQSVVKASPILTNIQNMDKNDFFRKSLLSDQQRIVVESLINDQEWILAGSSGNNEDEKSNPYRSMADMHHYLAVAKGSSYAGFMRPM